MNKSSSLISNSEESLIMAKTIASQDGSFIQEEENKEQAPENEEDVNLYFDEEEDNRDYIYKKSFSTNLQSFTKADQDILGKINKFYKISGTSKPSVRELLVTDDFTKLIYDKSISKDKPKSKNTFLISDINEIYNGIEHSENIKKYIKANPQEEKLSNHFITIILNKNKEQLDFKSDDLESVLLWFKALKGLLHKVKTENNKKKEGATNNFETKIKTFIDKVWEYYLLPNWNIYGNFLLLKSNERNYFLGNNVKEEKQQ